MRGCFNKFYLNTGNRDKSTTWITTNNENFITMISVGKQFHKSYICLKIVGMEIKLWINQKLKMLSVQYFWMY